MKYKELRDGMKAAVRVALELADTIDFIEKETSMVVVLTPETYEWLEANYEGLQDQKMGRGNKNASQVPVSE